MFLQKDSTYRWTLHLRKTLLCVIITENVRKLLNAQRAIVTGKDDSLITCSDTQLFLNDVFKTMFPKGKYI